MRSPGCAAARERVRIDLPPAHPDDLAGHALGLQSSGTLAMQGVGAALAGLVAEQTGPGTAMAVMAAISVTVTPLLAPGLRSPSSDQKEETALSGAAAGPRARA